MLARLGHLSLFEVFWHSIQLHIRYYSIHILHQREKLRGSDDYLSVQKTSFAFVRGKGELLKRVFLFSSTAPARPPFLPLVRSF